jgi:Mrp family chromosome partitioning ATPase
LNLGGPDLQTLGVTSTSRGEGRTNLALAMALIQARDYRRRVVLLDLTNFESVSLADRFHAKRQPGLAELVEGGAPLALVRQPVGEGLMLISAGRFTEATMGPVISALRAGLLRELRGEHDVLIADLPPLLGSSLARVTATEFQRLAVVVAAGRTSAQRLQEAMVHLQAEPELVLVGTRSRLPRWLQALIGT